MTSRTATVIPLRSPQEEARNRERLAVQRYKARAGALLQRAMAGERISTDANTQAYWECMARSDREGAKAVIRRVRETFGLASVEHLLLGEPITEPPLADGGNAPSY